MVENPDRTLSSLLSSMPNPMPNAVEYVFDLSLMP